MKRFIFGSIILALLLVACAPVVMPGQFQVAPAPMIGSVAIETQFPSNQLFLAPQVSTEGKAKVMCDAAAALVRKEVPTLKDIIIQPGESKEVTEKKIALHNAVSLLSGPLCREWYSVSVENNVYTVGGPKAISAATTVPSKDLDVASKTDIAKAKAQCEAYAKTINEGKFEMFWFVDQSGDTPEVRVQKKQVFDTLEALGGASCSKWYSVRVVGGVYVIYDK